MPEMRGPRGGRRPGDLRPGARERGGARPFRPAPAEPLLPGQPAAAAAAGLPPFWEGLLEPGERVLWAGRPRPGLGLSGPDGVFLLMGLVFLAFAVAAGVQAMRPDLPGGQGVGVLLGLLAALFGAAGVAFLVGPPLRARARSARIAYVLTNRRAMVLTAGAEPDLAAYAITPAMRLRLVPGRPGSVFFARDVAAGRGGPPRPGGGPRRPARIVEVGFERIDDAEAVFRLMRRLQGAAGAGAGP